MNSFYIAKKQLKYAGICDLVFASIWALLIFIFAIYSFGYLVPGNYVVGDAESSSTPSSINSATGIVKTKGYSGLFDIVLINFIFFKLTLWTIVVILWSFMITCFVLKIFLGSFALFKFFKGKSIQHIYAALAVIFFPAVGGIVAINTYKATTSTLAPKYVSPYSFIRFRLRKLWTAFWNSDKFQDETEAKNIGNAK